MKRDVDLVSVFSFEGSGGNPCPIVVDGEVFDPGPQGAIELSAGPVFTFYRY